MSSRSPARLGLFLTLVLSACTADQSGLPAVGTLERERIELVAEDDEPIIEMQVREGERVKAKQILLRLDARRHQMKLAQARARVQRDRERLAELVRGPRREVIVEARARLAGAEARYVTSQREYARVESLVVRDLLSPADLDDAHAQRDIAQSERDQAAARLQATVEGTTTEELNQARAAVAEAEAAVRALEIELQRMTVRAPLDGIVDALPYYVGERPPDGATVAVMLSGRPYARVYIPAPLRPRIQPGTRAAIRLEGMHETFPGRVRFVATEAAFTPYFALTERDRSRLSYLSEIDVTAARALELPVGQPVTVDFPALHRGEP